MLYSSIANSELLKNSKEASAFVGLTPKQHSSDSKVFMIGIDKKHLPNLHTKYEVNGYNG
jgi:transposase